MPMSRPAGVQQWKHVIVIYLGFRWPCAMLHECCVRMHSLRHAAGCCSAVDDGVAKLQYLRNRLRLMSVLRSNHRACLLYHVESRSRRPLHCHQVALWLHNSASLSGTFCVFAQQHTSAAGNFKSYIPGTKVASAHRVTQPSPDVSRQRPVAQTLLSQLSLHADNCTAWTAHSR